MRGQKVSRLRIKALRAIHIIAVADPEHTAGVLTVVDLVEISEVDPIDSSGVDQEVSEAVLEAELEAVMVSVEVLEADPEVDSVDTLGADMVVFRSIISHRMII